MDGKRDFTENLSVRGLIRDSQRATTGIDRSGRKRRFEEKENWKMYSNYDGIKFLKL